MDVCFRVEYKKFLLLQNSGTYTQGRIQDFSQGGPGASEATDRKWGSGGVPPRKNLNLRGSNIDL